MLRYEEFHYRFFPHESLGIMMFSSPQWFSTLFPLYQGIILILAFCLWVNKKKREVEKVSVKYLLEKERKFFSRSRHSSWPSL